MYHVCIYGVNQKNTEAIFKLNLNYIASTVGTAAMENPMN